MADASGTAGRRKGLLAVLAVAALVAAVAALHKGGGRRQPLPYIYEDTRRLVLLVEAAAARMEQIGDAAYAEFSVPNSRWRDGKRYLFAYSPEGVCLFHPETPELVGRDLIALKDINGRRMIERIAGIGRMNDRSASGWTFYLWQDHAELTPTWKSSYVRKVVTPSGKTLVIGCGAHDLKIEPSFVKQCVDSACELLASSGKDAAFAQFRDRAAPFSFLDVLIFVFDQEGRSAVDPAFPNMEGRGIAGFRDATGRPVIREALQKLRKSNEVWTQYLMPKPGAATPSRKLMYLRKVTVNGETFIVGASYFMPTPIWMRL